MTGQRLDKALLQPTAVVTGVAPTCYGLALLCLGKPSLSKAVLCGANLSLQKEALSWRSESQQCEGARCFLQHPGRAEERDTEAKDLRGWEQQVSTLTVQGEQRGWGLFGAVLWDEWEHQAC